MTLINYTTETGVTLTQPDVAPEALGPPQLVRGELAGPVYHGLVYLMLTAPLSGRTL